MFIDGRLFRTFDQYKLYLLLRSDYPLGLIYSAKNLAKKVSRDQELDDKVSLIGPDKDTAILGKITLKLKDIGELHRAVLNDLNEIHEGLLGISTEDAEWPTFQPEEILVDLVNSTQPGYCFGDEGANGLKKYEDAGLNVLFNHPRFKDRYGCMVSGDKFIPNAVACHDFLRQSSLGMSKVATLLHIGPGNPPRGTESTSQFFRNHPRGNIRNVKIINGELCLVAGYNKTSSLVSYPS